MDYFTWTSRPKGLNKLENTAASRDHNTEIATMNNLLRPCRKTVSNICYLFTDIVSFSLRLPPGNSLFDTVPSHISTLNSRRHCTCQEEMPRFSSPRAPSQPTSSSDPSCSNHGNMHFPSVVPTLDVTAEYITSVELLSENEREPLPSRASRVSTSAYQQPRGRRSAQRFISNSPHQSLSQSDLEGVTYFFPEDHEPAVQPESPLTWPTPSGLTEQQAQTQCRQTVANSSIVMGCRHLLKELFVNHAVTMCVTDLQLKDEQSWLNATIPLLENECERRLLEEGEGEEKYQDAVAILKCPNLCNGNGQCSNWGCVCFPGFSSYDCSALSGNIYPHETLTYSRQIRVL